MRKRGSCKCALIGGYWQGEAAGGPTKSRTGRPRQLARGTYLLSLVGPKLKMGVEIREAVSY